MTYTDQLTIRPARDADTRSLADLAELDSSSMPAGDVLVAETAGRLVAALDLADGRAVANPFLPTAETVALLRMRAAQLEAPNGHTAKPRSLFGLRLANG